MPFVTDSRFAGYLGPVTPGPAPLEDDSWEDFLHDVFAGVTGLDPTLVRPRWQEEPPLRPDISVDWMAFGTHATRTDFVPVTYHLDNVGDGYDAMQEMEELDILCSFYGPNAEKYQSYCRRGLYVDQNQAVFRANAVGMVSTTGFTRAAELFKDRWWPRSDMTVTLRREVRYNYSVLNLLRARGIIDAQPPGRSDIIRDTFDTSQAPQPQTTWDAPPPNDTVWDDGQTVWDWA
jgi:hypothetical protein